MIYLSIQDVIAIHAEMIRQFGGELGLRDQNLLESAIRRPQQSAGLEDAYPDLFSKAAALLQSLAKNHCFVDGNKRVAFMSTYVFIRLNGFHLKAPQEDAVQFVVQVASGEIKRFEVMEAWLRKHSKKSR